MNSPTEKRHQSVLFDRKWKRVLLSTLCILLAVAIVAVTVYCVLWLNGKNSLLSGNAPTNTPSGVSPLIDDDGKTVIYNDEKYVFNDNMTSVLFIGVDNDINDMPSGVNGDGGQADALYLAAIDTSTGKTTIIAISRDIMTSVNVYSAQGKFAGVETMQVCLAYAYGDGKELSCENTVKAVSDLLCGIQINTYFCINWPAMIVINDMLGGVTVAEYDNNFKPTGRNVTLKGNAVLDYIRLRDTQVVDANVNRVQRQVNYLEALTDKIVEQTRKDISVPLKLYNKMSKHSINTIDISKITYLTSTFINNGAQLDFRTIEGEVKMGEKFAEMYPDEKALYEMLLDVFYTKQ